VSVRDDLFEIAEPVVQALGFELVDLEYAKEGPRWVLRVYLHRTEGVSLDDCQRVSEALSDRLDQDDPVKTAYHLEVSSPGAERVLKSEREMRIFAGRLVRVTLSEALPNEETGKAEQVVHGLLGPVTGEKVHLTGLSGKPVALDRAKVKQVRLALKSSAPAVK
jgi:ribosome maturation factor RimP